MCDVRSCAVPWSKGHTAITGTGENTRLFFAARPAKRADEQGRTSHPRSGGIVTLPLAVLSNDGVRFAPPLSGKQEAMALLATGHTFKVVLVFRSVFWEKEHEPRKALFAIDPRQQIPTWGNA